MDNSCEPKRESRKDKALGDNSEKRMLLPRWVQPSHM